MVDPRCPTAKLRNNLIEAERIVQLVGRYVHIGATNRWEDWKRSKLSLLGAAMSERFTAKNFRRMTGSIEGTRWEDVQDIAAATKRSGYGNCMEQSALAFVLLYESGVRPINLMEVENGDHAFTIIGILPDKAAFAAYPQNWGPDAVVCDPWAKAWYPASEIRRRRDPGEVYSSYLRASIGS
jgi:hypothetical protein